MCRFPKILHLDVDSRTRGGRCASAFFCSRPREFGRCQYVVVQEENRAVPQRRRLVGIVDAS